MSISSMPICNHNLSDLAVEHVQSEPGMAHFSGTGPRDKKCGLCIFWGYKKVKTGKINRITGEIYDSITHRDGCKKFYELTNKHGNKINPKLLSCKYFEYNDENNDVGK
jgi:hypothetical protein